MSAALQILTQSAEALAVAHDDILVVMPMDVPVSGYAQEMTGSDPQESGIRKTRAPSMFHTGEDLVSHIVFIRRCVLEGAKVVFTAVSSIQRPDKRVYRVKHATDDPNFPDVKFFCTLA